MIEFISGVIRFVGDSALDVLPIAAFFFLFQWLVIGQQIKNSAQVIVGFVFVVIGIGLFLMGLDQTLFPLGRMMASQLTDPAFLSASPGTDPTALTWRDFYWVYLFSAAIGFSTTMAEPSLIAVAIKANAVSGGAIGVTGLRVAVAIGVGLGVSLGCFRIVAGVPLQHIMVVGYFVVILQTMIAPKLIVPLAYDSGGVTTSTVTVPLITALGLGLAEAIPGRSVLLDGFGLVAFASLFPIISVLAYGQLAVLRKSAARQKPETNKQQEEVNAL